MTFICIFSPDWKSKPLDRMAADALEVVPRVALDSGKGLIWADGKSLELRAICQDLQAAFTRHGAARVQLGLALIPIAAEIAARFRGDEKNPIAMITHVPHGAEREFLHRHPIDALDPSPPLANLFDGTGIEMCGDLACLEQESVEVRFGAEAVHLWRLARADDNRLVFAAMPRTLPQSSMDWVDYTLADPQRLVFVINALVRERLQCTRDARSLRSRDDTRFFACQPDVLRASRAAVAIDRQQKAWMRLTFAPISTAWSFPIR